MTPQPATPHAEVNELLDSLTQRLREILGSQLVAAYLFGSATRGDFDRESDVDVVVVTADSLTDDLFSELHAMHGQIARNDSWCATELEISYIPRKAMRRYAPPEVLHPRLDRGKNEILHIMSHDADWVVQRHLIREHGTVLLGPAPQTVIDPVSADEMREAMRELIEEWLAPLIENPPHVRTRGYQSFLVLSTCRILYTLRHGDVVSKRSAALWGEEALDSRWTRLIKGAWIGRQNPDETPRPEDLTQTWSFIRYALEAVRR